MWAIPILVCFAASILTFFSGFGLGTVLLPILLIFFPVSEAVLISAIIHLSNNIFKNLLLFKNLHRQVFWAFGIAVIPSSFLGAWLSSYLQSPILFAYTFGTKSIQVHALNFIIGLLITLFSFEDVLKKLHNGTAPKAWVGGVFSGFFGGLSGHQGALRSVYLKPMIPDKTTFVATGAALALLVDFTRIPVYFGNGIYTISNLPWMVIGGCVAACIAGTIVGKRLLHKTRNQFIDNMVKYCLILFGLAMMAGWI